MKKLSGLLRFSIATGLLFLLVGFPNTSEVKAQDTQEVQETKIVFLAGPKDHGAVGRHEYEKDLRAMAWMLENDPNLEGITTEVRVGAAPADLDEIRDASVIVLNSSGDWLSDETHVLFPPFLTTDGRSYDAETTEYLNQFNELVESGVGLVIFHYTMWAENWVARSHLLNWFGGLWLPRASVNPVDNWTMTPTASGHPVLEGVQPWNYREEVYTRFHLPNDHRRTNLLLATPERSSVGTHNVAWVYKRDDGGRSFAFGSPDFHDNIYNIESYRRFLVNGILWTSGREIPEGGLAAPVPPQQ